jgi:hypothetical protein
MCPHSVLPLWLSCFNCVTAVADTLQFCGPHVVIVEASKPEAYYPTFPCYSHIGLPEVKVHLVVGLDGRIEDARVIGSEVTPKDMETCAADIARATALALRYSKPSQVCETTIKLTIRGVTIRGGT